MIKQIILSSICVSLMNSAFATTVLRFAHAHPQTDSQHKAAEFFAEEVKNKSKGELEVKIFPNGQLGNDNAMIDAVRGGMIDFELSGNPYFTGMAPELNALDIPFLFKDASAAYNVLDGQIGKELLGKLSAHGLVGLAFWEIGFRDLTNNIRPVQKAEDVKGLALRTTPNPIHLAFFSALGANPTPMPFAEVYTSLETKTIDGQENPVNLIKSAGLETVQKYLSRTKHAYTAAPLVMNKKKFDSLNEENKRVVIDAAFAAAKYQRELNAKQEADNLAFLKEKGMVVNEELDRESFKAIAQDAINKAVKGKPAEEYFKKNS
ncbi:hypothetical protein V757_10610 [Pelistega indica]|uniref:ABC transporter substrate-binding protein n=1 Tax=Pelistega indica TaxID=1414851 RepID=V8FV60_9BURK|nr:TRAP transporter substrate-binding protein [Pelistega indica]ETD68030.1 hypothetical protein V757_10610 [Pelistega indica]